VFLFVAIAVAAALRRPFEPRFLLALGGTLAAAGIVFVPWFVDWFTRLNAERLFVSAPAPMGVTLREASGFSLAGLPYALWVFTFGYTLGPSLLELHLDRSVSALVRHLPIVGVGLLAVGGAAVLGLRAAFARGRAIWVITIVAIPLALAILLAARDIKTFHPRYLVGFFPVLLACLAAGWAQRSWVARSTAVVALGLATLSLGNLFFNPAYGKEDSREAAQLLLREERPGDSVVVIYSFRPFRHYFADTAAGGARLHHVHKRFLRTDDQLRVHVADARKGSDRVWLVLSRWWDVAPEERILGIFEETLHETRRWEFHGIKVLLFEGRSA
jgi:hypothetical protein